KTETISKIQVPCNNKELKRFLGMIQFYATFIPDCAGIGAPLHRLSRKAVEWQWGPAEQSAFERLRDALASQVVLHLPDLKKQFHIQTDASTVGLGAVLLQEHEGKLRPVYFASRTLHGAEKNYSATELECLAVVWALRKFRMYIEYTDVILESD